MNRAEWNRIWGDEDQDHGHHGDRDGEHHRAVRHHEHAGHRHGHADADGLLVRTVHPLPVGRALDLGCGLGQNAIWLARQGWQVRAVDFSDVAIERASALAVRSGVEVDFVVGDLTEYEPPGSYDLVTLFYVHLPPAQRAALLGRAAAAVAPGGRLLFVGHDSSDSAWFEEHVRSQHDHQSQSDDSSSVDELVATLTSPDEISAELPGLEVERGEVVQHDPHCAGQQAGTTLVLARRAGSS